MSDAQLVDWSDEQLKAAGISKAKLTSLVKRLRACARDLDALGLTVYGESGTGYLIHKSRPEHDAKGNADFGAIVARVGQGFDGGGW